MRHQLAVSSPLRASTLGTGVAAALGARDPRRTLAGALASRFGAACALLTDSGTAALVLALRLAAGRGGTVAFPGYACIDLAAAARRAEVRVRLYDLDPLTLAPDLDSLRDALRRGASAVVVVHLFGYPADVPGVRRLAAEQGAVIIEDAAQAAGAALHGTPLGGFGPLSILSFGRGKGITGGSGGALLAIGDDWAERVDAAGATVASGGAGWAAVARAGAQWALGRPALYGIPAAIPALALGEMVYRPAGEPRRIARAAAAMAHRSLLEAPRELARRRANAAALLARLERLRRLQPVRPIAGAEPGHLRLPVLDSSGAGPEKRLGIARPYPLAMIEMRELHPALHSSEPEQPGARELARTLLTLPTHGMVGEADLRRIDRWLGARAGMPERHPPARAVEVGPRTARQ